MVDNRLKLGPNPMIGPNMLGPVGQPPVSSLDPSTFAQTFFQDLLKKHSDAQTRLNLTNKGKINCMQQALASMYAATNLYQIMSRTNWTFKPPSTISFQLDYPIALL